MSLAIVTPVGINTSGDSAVSGNSDDASDVMAICGAESFAILFCQMTVDTKNKIIIPTLYFRGKRGFGVYSGGCAGNGGCLVVLFVFFCATSSCTI